MFRFIFVISGVLVFTYIYVGRRLIKPLDLAPHWSWALWGLWLLPFVLQFISRSYREHQWLQYLSYSLLGVVAFLLFTYLYIDLARGFAHAVTAFKSYFSNESLVSEERRNFFTRGFSLGVLGGVGLVSGYSMWRAQRGPQVIEKEVPVKDLPIDLQGLKIVQLSDIHLGPTIKEPYIQKIAEICQDLKPDLIAVTGDLVDARVEDMADQLQALGTIEAKYGKFYCTGNHEYYWGALDWITEMEKLGYTALNNENRLIQIGKSQLLVAGVTDLTTGHRIPGHASDPHKAMRGGEKADFKMVLAHQPKSCFGADEAGFDLQLSGHTHGGQILPWVPFVFFYHPYFIGLNRHKDRMWVYVNRGTGYWGPPMRLAIPSEITLLTLVRA